jgi:hypothetical protein
MQSRNENVELRCYCDLSNVAYHIRNHAKGRSVDGALHAGTRGKACRPIV